MPTYVIPHVGLRGVYKLKEPFASKVKETEILTCRAVRNLSDYVAGNDNPYKTLYEPMKLTVEQYNADLAENMVIVSLQSSISKWLYIPVKYIQSYPNNNGVAYHNLMMTVALGPMPVSNTVEVLENKVLDDVYDHLGVTGLVRTVQTSDPYSVTADMHETIETTRNSRVDYVNSAAGKLNAAEVHLAAARAQIKKLDSGMSKKLTQLADAQRDIVSLNTTIDGLKSDIGTLNAALNAAQAASSETIADLQSELADKDALYAKAVSDRDKAMAGMVDNGTKLVEALDKVVYTENELKKILIAENSGVAWLPNFKIYNADLYHRLTGLDPKQPGTGGGGDGGTGGSGSIVNVPDLTKFLATEAEAMAVYPEVPRLTDVGPNGEIAGPRPDIPLSPWFMYKLSLEVVPLILSESSVVGSLQDNIDALKAKYPLRVAQIQAGMSGELPDTDITKFADFKDMLVTPGNYWEQKTGLFGFHAARYLRKWKHFTSSVVDGGVKLSDGSSLMKQRILKQDASPPPHDPGILSIYKPVWGNNFTDLPSRSICLKHIVLFLRDFGYINKFKTENAALLKLLMNRGPIIKTNAPTEAGQIMELRELPYGMSDVNNFECFILTYILGSLTTSKPILNPPFSQEMPWVIKLNLKRDYPKLYERWSKMTDAELNTTTSEVRTSDYVPKVKGMIELGDPSLIRGPHGEILIDTSTLSTTGLSEYGKALQASGWNASMGCWNLAIGHNPDDGKSPILSQTNLGGGMTSTVWDNTIGAWTDWGTYMNGGGGLPKSPDVSPMAVGHDVFNADIFNTFSKDYESIDQKLWTPNKFGGWTLISTVGTGKEIYLNSTNSKLPQTYVPPAGTGTGGGTTTPPSPGGGTTIPPGDTGGGTDTGTGTGTGGGTIGTGVIDTWTGVPGAISPTDPLYGKPQPPAPDNNPGGASWQWDSGSGSWYWSDPNGN